MLVDQQARDAALDVHRSFCVSAPAGSGKTELLTQRVLALLLTVEEPEQILAITFTRKAKAEMAERINRALLLGLGPEPEEAYKRTTWQAAQAVLARDIDLGWQLIENPNRLRIQTIDSLNQSIASESPLLNGFGAAPVAVDNASTLYESLLPALVALLEDEDVQAPLSRVLLWFNGDVERFGELLAQLLAKRDQWMMYLAFAGTDSGVKDYLAYALEQWQCEDIAKLYTLLKPYEGGIIDSLQFATKHLVDDQLAAIADGCLLPEPVPQALAEWRALIDWLFTATGTARKSLTKKQGFPAPSSMKDKAEKALATAAKTTAQALMAELSGIEGLSSTVSSVRSMPALLSEEQADNISDLLMVLKLAVAHLQLRFAETGQCDHLQVAQQALRLLGQDDEPSSTQISWTQRVRHILIDEYQDTSFNQNALLSRLVQLWDESREINPEQLRSLFVVGDGMQSIYRFRAANVGLFIRAQSHGIGAEPLTHLQLQQNFRSRQGLVEWFNTVFEPAFPLSAEPSTGAVPYNLAVATDQSGEGLTAIDGYNDEAAEAAAIAERCARLLKDSPDDSIAVLVRSKRHLNPLIDAFKTHGVDFVGTDTERLLEVPAVADAFNLALWLMNPTDNLVFTAILRAPWAGVTLDELHAFSQLVQRKHSWFLQLNDALCDVFNPSAKACITALRLVWQQRARKSFADQLSGLWYALKGDVIAGADSLYVQQLFDGLREAKDVSTPNALRDWVADRFAVPVPKPRAVQLMSIHKSKGLEFDSVFLMGLGKTGAADSSQLLEYSERLMEDGTQSFLLAAFGRTVDDKQLRQYINALDKQAASHELLRLLYVGVTRAVQRLYLSFVYKVDEKTGDKKAPARRSLLHFIWPQVEDACVFHDAPLMQADIQYHAPIRRLNEDVFTQTTLPESVAFEAVETPSQSSSTTDEAAVGIVVHELLEYVAKIGLEACSEERLSHIARQLVARSATVVDKATANEFIHTIVLTLVQSDTARWLLAPRPSAKTEWPVGVVNTDRSVSHYIIDRYFEEDGAGWIVDYKSSQPSEGESLASFIDKQVDTYKYQLIRYQYAVKMLFSARDDIKQIKTALYFPAIDVLHELSAQSE